jgi:hypothetical protein
MIIVIGGMAVFATIAMLLAFLLSFSLHDGDPLSNFFSQTLHLILMGISWVAIGALLLVTGVRARHAQAISTWMLLILSLLTVGATCVAVMIARRLYERHVGYLEYSALATWSFFLPLVFLIAAAWLEFRSPLNGRWVVAILGPSVLIGLAMISVSVSQLVFPVMSRREISVDDIFLPAILIHDQQVIEVISRPEDLHTMSSNQYMGRSQNPVLVDSNFAIYSYANLKMRGHELSLLITGPRRIEIDFRFQPIGTPSLGRAKELILEISSFARDSEIDEQIRKRILRQETMRGIVGAIQQEPPGILTPE